MNLHELAQSKKAKMTGLGAVIVGIAAVILPYMGATPEVTDAVIIILGFIISSYNVGQGVADFKKEQARVIRGSRES